MDKMAAQAPQTTVDNLARLKESIVRCMALVGASAEEGSLATEESLFLREAVRRYIPDWINSCLRVPQKDRGTLVIDGNKPALDLLHDQLQMVQQQLDAREAKLTRVGRSAVAATTFPGGQGKRALLVPNVSSCRVGASAKVRSRGSFAHPLSRMRSPCGIRPCTAVSRAWAGRERRRLRQLCSGRSDNRGGYSVPGFVSGLALAARSIRSASCLSRTVLATVKVLLTRNSQLHHKTFLPGTRQYSCATGPRLSS